MATRGDGDTRFLGHIDALRFVAAMLVVVSHGKLLLRTKYDVQYLGVLAYWGVELFFVISGFLLVPVVQRIVLEGRYLPDIGKFVAKRSLRILPLYLIFVVVNVYAHKISDPVPYFFFLQGLPPEKFAESWSLQAEECFYLLLIFLGLLCWKTRRPLAWSLWLLVIASIIVRMFLYPSLGTSFDAEVRRNALLRLDSLAIGGLLGLGVLKGPFPRAELLAGVAAMLAVSLAFDTFYSTASWWGVLFLLPLSSLLLAPWVGTPTGWLEAIGRWRLGNLSYPLYLANIPCVLVSGRLPLPVELKFVAYLFLSLLCAYLLWWAVDRPIEKTRKSITYSFTTPRPSTAG